MPLVAQALRQLHDSIQQWEDERGDATFHASAATAAAAGTAVVAAGIVAEGYVVYVVFEVASEAASELQDHRDSLLLLRPDHGQPQFLAEI